MSAQLASLLDTDLYIDALGEIEKFELFTDLPFSPQTQLDINSPHCAPMWRRSLHDRFGYFDESYTSAGDYEFWVRCAMRGAVLKGIPDLLTLYYQNPNGMSTRDKHQPMCHMESARAQRSHGVVGVWTRPRDDHPAAPGIVSVNTADHGGGGETMARQLFEGYGRRGLESWLLVGDKKGDDPRVMPFFASPHVDYRPYARLAHRVGTNVRKKFSTWCGMEDFEFPYTRLLGSITGSEPAMLHLHNLHGPYFDLRVLPDLSARMPVFLTLHDSWLLTGHCSIPAGCRRWETGCGACPDLARVPAIRRDATRYNWKRKSGILSASRLHVATPSRWLMDRVERSMLAPSMVTAQVIPNGIDLNLFTPLPTQQARAQLALPDDAAVIVYAGTESRTSPHKDYATLHAALAIVGDRRKVSKLRCLVIGASGETEQLGGVTVHYIPFQDQEKLVTYLQAADLYVHPAREEAFGLVLAEAMACGTPVVATRVGGVPEVVEDGLCGLLVEAADPAAMARAIETMLTDHRRRSDMALAAAAVARERFNIENVVDCYLDWFVSVYAEDVRSAAAGSHA